MILCVTAMCFEIAILVSMVDGENYTFYKVFFIYTLLNVYKIDTFNYSVVVLICCTLMYGCWVQRKIICKYM